MHDALEDVCDRLLRTDTAVPDSGGTPATVIITIDLEDLLNGTGYGITSDGTLIRTDQVRTMTDQAEVYYAFLDRNGVVLNLGRTRRIASRGQSAALYARDAGCCFPGCDRAPEWCERHHVMPWIDGGATDLNNLTLLCVYHHHNFATRGWTCRINPDGLPEWRPPRWVDRDQKPMINTRIQATHTARKQARHEDASSAEQPTHLRRHTGDWSKRSGGLAPGLAITSTTDRPLPYARPDTMTGCASPSCPTPTPRGSGSAARRRWPSTCATWT